MGMYKEAAKLQLEYKRLFHTGRLSKKVLCELCIPFRDKYGLTDVQALRIAREQMSLSELVELAESRKSM